MDMDIDKDELLARVEPDPVEGVDEAKCNAAPYQQIIARTVLVPYELVCYAKQTLSVPELNQE